jgi:glutaminyl-tRNA synthetase
MLEHCVRETLNQTAPRYLAVLRPLKLIIDNYPEGKMEEFEAPNNPNDTSSGKRMLPFAREIFIEQEDFLEDPPKKFFRLAPGKEVRLRYAYLITCRKIIKNSSGEITEIHCTYDPETKGGNAPDGRKVKGTLHWVAAEYAHHAEIRLFEHLFSNEEPDLTDKLMDAINPESRQILEHCILEPALAELEIGASVQFERLGYFCRDLDATKDADVWNRTISLRDSWAKASKTKNA